MTPDRSQPMNAELRDVLELLEKATGGIWIRDDADVYTSEAPDDGGDIVASAPSEEFDCSRARWQENAAAIVAAVNFLRKHGEALSRPVVPDGDGWMPIETAPKDGTPVLGFWRVSLGTFGGVNGTSYGITAFNAHRGEWYDASEADNEDDEWVRPDYWRPLPAPPAARSAEDN